MIDPALKEQVEKVISYSQGIQNPIVLPILEKWHKAKKPLMDTFFDGQVSYTYPERITFELNEDSKIQRYDQFIDYVNNLFNWAEDNPFLDYLESIDSSIFYSNSLPWDYIMDDGKKIQQGTKIIKSFKYFLKDNLLFDIQNKASELIQENKVEGYLTFSVHPLDFLSSSENTFNWRSCHSLDGEYRVGNFSYMMDSSTVICFLETGNNTKLPHFPEDVPWNNKKWRMLLHFNTKYDVVFAGRQYPFTSPGALDVVRQVFYDELVKTRFFWGDIKKPKWSYWHNDYVANFLYSEHEEDGENGIEDERYAPINRGIWDINKIFVDAKNSKHFNDITRSSCYTKPYYMFERQWGPHGDLKFEIGSEVTCLSCGKRIIDAYDSMLCPDCDYENGEHSDWYTTCSCCGTVIHRDHGYWVGDEYLCENCYKTETFYCEVCGETCYNEHKHYIESNDCFVCSGCYETIKKKEEEELDGERNPGETRNHSEVKNFIW